MFCTVATLSSTPCYTISKPFLDRCVNISFGIGTDEKVAFIEEMMQLCAQSLESRKPIASIAEEIGSEHTRYLEGEGGDVTAALLEGTAEDATKFLNLRGLERALAVCRRTSKKSKPLPCKQALRAAYGIFEPGGE